MDRKRNKKHKSDIITTNDLLMIPLSKFYQEKSHINAILPIIEGNESHKRESQKISLRLIDWFITNYSKKREIIITRRERSNVIHFNVYLSYRNQLKAYSKKLFDPFRRRDRITFFYENKKSIETTVGQLNIFKWILENDILSYIKSHFSIIESDMIKTQRDNMRRKLTEDNIRTRVIQGPEGPMIQKRKKRNQLSKSCIKNMSFMNSNRTLKFD